MRSMDDRNIWINFFFHLCITIVTFMYVVREGAIHSIIIVTNSAQAAK